MADCLWFLPVVKLYVTILLKKSPLLLLLFALALITEIFNVLNK